jgi:hypothetical protein
MRVFKGLIQLRSAMCVQFDNNQHRVRAFKQVGVTAGVWCDLARSATVECM